MTVIVNLAASLIIIWSMVHQMPMPRRRDAMWNFPLYAGLWWTLFVTKGVVLVAIWWLA